LNNSPPNRLDLRGADTQRFVVGWLWTWTALGAISLAIYLTGFWPAEKIRGWLAGAMMSGLFGFPPAAWAAFRSRSWKYLWPGLASLALAFAAWFLSKAV
jgi:hypothetical protein